LRPIDTTDDAVLGGRLRLLQPKRGHRVGHDAILLAAATAAKAGEHVVEFGAGVGAAGLALAQRQSQATITLVEIDPDLSQLATENAARNGIADRVRILAADVETLDTRQLAKADRVLMNPPFNDPRRQTVSPDPKRRLAHVAEPGLLTRWIAKAAALLRDCGVVTLIWRADDLDSVLAALEPEFGSVAVLPIYPRQGAPAIRMLVRAVKGEAWALKNCAGLVLNNESGKPTQAAEAVLREGAMLALAEAG
jgi:tRNA1(Val) A37 N6-methylase TrmN6